MVPVCTSTTATGGTLCMDTSQVPQNIERECHCDFHVDRINSTVLVFYKGPGNKDCGISFKIEKNVSCNSVSYNMEDYSEEIIFSRASNSAANASVTLYIGKLIKGSGYTW